MADGASRWGRMCWIASVCFCTTENCWAKPSTVSLNSPVGTTLVHLFERFGLVYLQDSHGMQGRGCLTRSTLSFVRGRIRQLTGFGWETWTIPPSGSILWAQVHRDRSLHLGNARVPPGSPAIEGSEDRGGRRAASGHERGHPRLRQLLVHLWEKRHRGRMRL